MAAGSVPRVTGLSIFPIKSCKAVRVEEIEIDSHGVVGDRRLMLVSGKGRFISQRKVSKLATVTARFVDEGGKRLVHVSAPGMARDLKFEPKLEGERINVSIWDSYDVKAVDQGDEPAQWFSDLIGVGSTYNRLVASAENIGDEFQRLAINVPPELKVKLPTVKMVLQDDGPVSLISAESLADLNRRLKERTGNELPLKRFRMNIEISGCSRPFEEDEWLEVMIGSVPFIAYANAEVSGCRTMYYAV